MQTREEALALLKKYNQSDALVRHGLSVAAILRHFAEIEGEDADYWEKVGLLHDLDYEKYPEQHCVMNEQLLREAGYDDAFIHAVDSHGWGMCSDIEPQLRMEKALYAVDELAGLITAAAYMRPSRSVLDMEVKSVKKKFKAPSFAAGVNREVILKGCEMLGLTLDEVIAISIDGMKAAAEEIGLAG